MIDWKAAIAELNALVNPEDNQTAEGGTLEGFCVPPNGNFGLYAFVGRSESDPYSCFYYLNDEGGKTKTISIEETAVKGKLKEVHQTTRYFKNDPNPKLIFKIETASGKVVSLDTGRYTVFAKGVVQGLMSLHDEGYDFTENVVYITGEAADQDDAVVFGGALKENGSYENGRDYNDYDESLEDLLAICGTGGDDEEEEPEFGDDNPSAEPNLEDIPF